MTQFAALPTVCAGLPASVAWPALIATIIVVFRVQRRSSFKQLPSRIQRAEKAKLEVGTKSIPPTDLDRQIERLCVEYGAPWQTLPSRYERTSAMNRIMAQMRIIGRPSPDRSTD